EVHRGGTLRPNKGPGKAFKAANGGQLIEVRPPDHLRTNPDGYFDEMLASTTPLPTQAPSRTAERKFDEPRDWRPVPH
ncbi:hypothetical protein, partial [Arthrobacter rhombi]|uniref:hypothetical protein n=1 Tax=Arthrobacter rhombi TaxID=71253 RepID=UPI003FD55CCB